MNREHWKKMLPTIQAFVGGATVKHMGMVVEQVSFTDICSSCEVVKPKERVPLEAEDWIEDGPWWIRGGPEDQEPALVSGCNLEGPYWINDKGGASVQTWTSSMLCERRNATSDWVPCWKEKG